jgi:hypothetical protein
MGIIEMTSNHRHIALVLDLLCRDDVIGHTQLSSLRDFGQDKQNAFAFERRGF